MSGRKVVACVGRLGWGVVGTTALALVLVAGPAAGQTPDDPDDPDGDVPEGVTLDAVAGFDGVVADGRAYPLTVTVTSDRLLRATLQVDLAGPMRATTLEREVEVAGGNSATFRFLAPGVLTDAGRGGGMPPEMGGSRVRLVADGESVATAEVTPQPNDPSQELVGVLPEAVAATGTEGSLPNAVPLLVDVGVARPVPVDPEVLDLGALALAPLDQLVATPAELAALPDDDRAAVTVWVEAGGHLVLTGDADDVAAVEAVLPEGWAPAEGDSVRAGLGQVRSVPGAWTDQLLPTPTRSAVEEDILAQDLIFASDTVSGNLSGDAGVRLPPGARLGVMLGLYVLVVGPVAYLVLRRVGRRQLAWGVIPVLALSSTGLVVATGGPLRRSASSAHVTVYETGAGGTTATTWSLVSDPRRRGEVGVRLPDGWTAGDAFEPWDDRGSPVTVSLDAEGLEATTEPPAGGYGVIQSQGPAPDLDGALVVTAESAADGVVRGTVRNGLDVTLEAVAVLVGRAAIVDVGTLEPGQEAPYEIADATRYAFQADAERQVWPDESSGDWMVNVGGDIIRGDARGGVIMGDGGGGIVGQIEVKAEMTQEAAAADPSGARQANPNQPPPPPVILDDVPPRIDQVFPGEDGTSERSDHPAVLAAWSSVMHRTGWNYRPPGQVVAVGWTEELDAPVTPTGSGKVSRSRSAVVARATTAPAGDHVTDTAVVRSTVRGPLTESSNVDAIPAVVAFDLPSGVDGRSVDPSRLAFHLPGKFLSTDVWTGDGWTPLPDVPDRETAEVDLPAGAVVGGQVFVRWQHPQEVPPEGRELVLYEKEAS